MARRDLPPVPENPERSPPATVNGEELVTVNGLAGEPSLEARICAPVTATRAVLLCHPHPLYGGTMHSAVVLAIARVLAEQGSAQGGTIAWARFNYRGVGASEGQYDEGRGEMLDARAVLRELKRRAPAGAKVSVCGYSFGTWVGLRAAAIESGVERVALVAPAVRIFEFVKEDGAQFSGRLSIFLGDQDEFCDVDEAEALAKDLGASIRIFPGADHYFMRGRRALAEEVVPVIAPESA
jgi:alpha/beta superfamily hydrolase